MDKLSKEKIVRVLAQREKRSITDASLKPAAVLVPLFEKDGECYVLLIKRTEEMEYHKGQISFPGGTPDDKDKTLLDTALREAFEEVGLGTQDAEVLGELDDSTTITSKFIVSPFVAFIPYPYQFKVSRREVRELVEVPLSALLAPDSFKREPVVDGGETTLAYFVYYGDYVIWGATAEILKRFADLLLAEE